MTQERAIDLKRRTVEEAVRNFSKLDKIDHLEAGLSNFEALLSIHDVNEDNWMKHLRIVLRGKPAEMMEGLHLPVDTPYFDVKEELLHKCRITANSAGENLFRTNLEQWLRRDAAGMVDDLFRWGTRIQGDSTTATECTFNFVKEAWRNRLNN